MEKKVWITGGWKKILEEKEAEKVTDKTVTINGSRQNITSNYGRVFFTREAAVEWLTQTAIESVGQAQKRLDSAKEHLSKVQEL
jgi:hypothetical protein